MRAIPILLLSLLLAVCAFSQPNAPSPFGEALLSLTAMSESGEGFDSIATEEKITAGGYTDATKASAALPGARACLLSTYDQSYVAWFGEYATAQSAKAQVNALTTQVLAALGEDFKNADDYADPKKGTFMRFFYLETAMTRSSAVVAIELAFFQNKYQVRLSVPSKAPEYYNRCSYYDAPATAEHEAFKNVFLLLQKGVHNDFVEIRGELLSEDLLAGKTYALKTSLPGMKCTATVGSVKMSKEYCNCQTEALYPSYTDTNLPFYQYLEYLVYVFQPQDYVIARGSNTPEGDIETLDMAPARPSKITSEKVTSLYIEEASGGYRIGIRIRDVSEF